MSVRIVQGLNGMSGSFTGMMKTVDGRTVRSLENDLWAIKERPVKPVQLVAAHLSIPVMLDNLSCTPHQETLEGHERHLVSFGFRQVGNLPFDARV